MYNKTCGLCFDINRLIKLCQVTEPTGPSGEENLFNTYPEGNIGDSYLVNGDLYVWDKKNNTWNNVGRIMEPTGPSGDLVNRSAYIITFENGTSSEGIPINSNDRLPLTREELDISDIVTLDSNNQTIKFNEEGYYKIEFIVSAYPLKNNTTFDIDNDYVAIGFREVNTDNIYVGGSLWNGEEVAKQVVGKGIISVPDSNKVYELVNVSPNTIYLRSPDKNLNTNSFFVNNIVNITIEYLGRQGA